jgi:hypothetical protein
MVGLIVTVALVALLSYAAGALVTRATAEKRVQECACKAIAGRIAVGKILPALEVATLGDYSNNLAGGEAAGGLIEKALHVAKAYLWGSGRYYRHLKRGTHYEVLSYELNLQASDTSLLTDGAELVLYVDTRSGRLSARHPVEFHDGRFVGVSRDEALDADDLAAQINAGRPSKGYVDPDRDLIGRLSGVPDSAGGTVRRGAPGDYRGTSGLRFDDGGREQRLRDTGL